MTLPPRSLSQRAWDRLTAARAIVHERVPSDRGGRAGGRRITFLQYGDFGEAYQRLVKDGGEENYFAQRYTVDAVVALSRRPDVEAVSVVTISRDQAPTQLEDKLTVGGVHLYRRGERPRMSALMLAVDGMRPTDAIACTPARPVIAHLLARGVSVLPLFADSFRAPGARQRLRSARLAWTLNDPRIRVVANHNIAAAQELVRIGVSAKKVVPFDWPEVISPLNNAAKRAPPSDRPFALAYVGQVNEPKGVGDLIRAVARLKQDGFSVRASIVGLGDIDALAAVARRLGVERQVEFLGMQSHRAVLALMRAHDAVVVPSRHAYPEGLPMTLYEGLCSRSPLIASDHPMFALRVRHMDNALVFEAGRPNALAACVRQLATDGTLYARLSEAGGAEAGRWLCPLKWDVLITSWLGFGGDDIRRHALA